MDSPKKMGLIIAAGMPPPNKLKRARMGDEGESDSEAADEAESGGSGGEMALGAMWDALKAGDKTGAWDAFCDAIDMAKNRSGGEGSGSDSDNY